MIDTYLTSKELFDLFAPAFNFELDEEGLVAVGIKRNFITRVKNPTGDYLYLVNQDYISGVST